MKKGLWFLAVGLLAGVGFVWAGVKMETYGNPKAKIVVKVYMPLSKTYTRGPRISTPELWFKEEVLTVTERYKDRVYVQLIDLASPEASKGLKKGSKRTTSIWINGKNRFESDVKRGLIYSKPKVVFEGIPRGGKSQYNFNDVDTVLQRMVQKK